MRQGFILRLCAPMLFGVLVFGIASASLTQQSSEPNIFSVREECHAGQSFLSEDEITQAKSVIKNLTTTSAGKPNTKQYGNRLETPTKMNEPMRYLSGSNINQIKLDKSSHSFYSILDVCGVSVANEIELAETSEYVIRYKQNLDSFDIEVSDELLSDLTNLKDELEGHAKQINLLSFRHTLNNFKQRLPNLEQTIQAGTYGTNNTPSTNPEKSQDEKKSVSGRGPIADGSKNKEKLVELFANVINAIKNARFKVNEYRTKKSKCFDYLMHNFYICVVEKALGENSPACKVWGQMPKIRTHDEGTTTEAPQSNQRVEGQNIEIRNTENSFHTEFLMVYSLSKELHKILYLFRLDDGIEKINKLETEIQHLQSRKSDLRKSYETKAMSQEDLQSLGYNGTNQEKIKEVETKIVAMGKKVEKVNTGIKKVTNEIMEKQKELSEEKNKLDEMAKKDVWENYDAIIDELSKTLPKFIYSQQGMCPVCEVFLTSLYELCKKEAYFISETNTYQSTTDNRPTYLKKVFLNQRDRGRGIWQWLTGWCKIM